VSGLAEQVVCARLGKAQPRRNLGSERGSALVRVRSMTVRAGTVTPMAGMLLVGHRSVLMLELGKVLLYHRQM
jgi:hypothetical protein